MTVLFLHAISVININKNNLVERRYLYLITITYINLMLHIFQNAFHIFISAFKKKLYHKKVAGHSQ